MTTGIEGTRPRPEVKRPVEAQVEKPKAQPEVKPTTETPREQQQYQRDAMEPADKARARDAAEKVSGEVAATASAQEKGIQAARTIDEVRTGIEQRSVRLSRANREVGRLETRLGQQLQNLSPALTPQQRQAYADAYRKKHEGAYREAREASQDLAKYMADNVDRVNQATKDLAGHPVPGAVRDMPARVNMAMQNGVRELDTAIRQSPTGNPELQGHLQRLGERFQDIANRAGDGNPDPGNRSTPSTHVVERAGLGATGFGIGQLATSVTGMAARAAGAFGLVGGLAGAPNNLGPIVNGEGRPEHYAGAAGNAAQIVGGVLRVGGVAVGATIGMAGTVAAIGAGVVTAYRDRQQYVSEVRENLEAAGIARGQQADALARSNPAALQRLQQNGYTPEQIRAISDSAPNTVRMHESTVSAVIEGARRLGMSPQQMADFLKQMGPERADTVVNQMGRIMGGNPGITGPRILEEMARTNGFEQTEAGRQAAEYLRRILQAN